MKVRRNAATVRRLEPGARTFQSLIWPRRPCPALIQRAILDSHQDNDKATQ